MMCKDETAKPVRCGKNSFRLIGKPKTYFKGTTMVDFKPIEKTKKIQKKAILPTFNKDNKHFTPAFIIPCLPQEPDELMLDQHQKRVTENTTEISEILVPKPRSRQKYCGVCRDYYEEYLTHIQLDRHKERMRNSVFQGYIVEQCEKFVAERTEKQEAVSEQEPEFHKINSENSSFQTNFPVNQYAEVDAYFNFN